MFDGRIALFTALSGALILALLAAGCATPAPFLPAREIRCLSACGCDADGSLEFEYYGASGFRLRRGGDDILLGPFFSNVGLFRGLVWGIRSDTDAIDRYLGDVSGVKAILVGHAHYDHLLDVPYIAREKATRATVYASETAVNILAAEGALKGRTRAVNANAWSDGDSEEKWIQITDRVRILPLRSLHAPHFLGYTAMRGRESRPRRRLPWHALAWKEGQTLAFLIDFLSPSKTVDYRIYYQDSATNFRIGMPPLSTAGTVDLALPCVASFSQVAGHPETLAQDVAPTHWLLGHWEDFFRPYSQDPRELRDVPLTDVPAFRARLHATGVAADAVTQPLPGQRFRYQRCP